MSTCHTDLGAGAGACPGRTTRRLKTEPSQDHNEPEIRTPGPERRQPPGSDKEPSMEFLSGSEATPSKPCKRFIGLFAHVGALKRRDLSDSER